MPESPERTALHDVYSTQEADGLHPFLEELYPKFLPSLHHLGTAGSCPEGGPGVSYGMWDFDEVELVRVIKWGTPSAPTPTSLYRLFDKTGTLLYVGISGTPEQRWVHHSENKTWWPEVARIEFDWRASRERALHSEAQAIRAENPLYNVHHNGSRSDAT